MARAALLAAALAAVAHAKTYSVRIISAPSSPVISFQDGSSPWPQSFNPSWVQPSPDGAVPEGLLVRAQNCTDWKPGGCVGCNVGPDHPLAPGKPFVGSVLAFARGPKPDGSFETPYLVFAPDDAAPTSEAYGTEDPRLRYDASTGQYHLFYTCYQGVSPGGCPVLCHASTANPTVPLGAPGYAWTRHGAVFGNKACGSKSGALLLRPSPPHYLIWGAGVIALATTDDLLNFTTVNASFITKREGFFDNQLVEAGPPPLALSDGNLLFLHNSDNRSTTGGDFGAYNPGYVILDGDDPSTILARSAEPLLSPVHGWETGTAPYMCNVHDVVFLEAARPVPGLPDVFDVWFGGSDAVIGTARIQVVIGA